MGEERGEKRLRERERERRKREKVGESGLQGKRRGPDLD
jgi:hypothetical protein